MKSRLKAAFLILCGVLLTVSQLANTGESQVKVDDNSFKCILDMQRVRHFYVDNLLGNVKGTVEVALANKGEYPVGSVLQLIPNEIGRAHV